MALAEDMAAAGVPIEFVIRAAKLEGKVEAIEEKIEQARVAARERSRLSMQRLRARRKAEKAAAVNDVDVNTVNKDILNDSATLDSEPLEYISKPRNNTTQAREARPRRSAADPSADASVMSDFEEFWQVFPKKVDKANARKAYLKARQGETVRGATPRKPVDHGTIMAGARAFAEECRRKIAKDPASEQYIKQAPAWLNGCRWEDYEQAKPVETRDEKLEKVYDYFLNRYVIERFWAPSLPEIKTPIPHPKDPNCPIPARLLAKYAPQFPVEDVSEQEYRDYRRRASRVAV
jgi:hypothetical protein